jgi:hypothetical protein
MIQVFRAMSLIGSNRTARMYNSILMTWRVGDKRKMRPGSLESRGNTTTQRSTAWSAYRGAGILEEFVTAFLPVCDTLQNEVIACKSECSESPAKLKTSQSALGFPRAWILLRKRVEVIKPNQRV